VALLSACASTTTVRVRPGTAEETRGVQQALVPLLGVLDPPLALDCPIGLGIVPAREINAGVALAKAKSGCQSLALVITEGTFRRLTLDMLRAILAHELGHVRLGHLEARRAHGEIHTVFTRAFERAQEVEADRFAVALLRKLEPRYPGSCIALVYVLALLTEQPAGPNRWLATHPSPERRADTARAGCDGSTALQP